MRQVSPRDFRTLGGNARANILRKKSLSQNIQMSPKRKDLRNHALLQRTSTRSRAAILWSTAIRVYPSWLV